MSLQRSYKKVDNMIRSILRSIVRNFREMRGVNRLIKRGLKVGRRFQFERGLLIDKIYPHLITIGDDVIFSADVKLLAHDAGLRNQMGIVRIGHVTIGNRCFVGLGTIVLPNVTIGDDVIIGAGSVVSKDIPSGSVAAGVPARVICSMEAYKTRIIGMKDRVPVYGYEKDPLTMTERERCAQKEALAHCLGFKKSINYEQFKSLE